MSALINSPPTTAVDSGAPFVNSEWRTFFVACFNILNAVTGSGTTLKRPTNFLYVGRPYFDTTLGKPIWLKSIGPTVWVDATGAPA